MEIDHDVEFEDLLAPDEPRPIFDGIGAGIVDNGVLDLSVRPSEIDRDIAFQNELDRTIDDFDRLWNQNTEQWPANVINEHELDPESPHIIELENGQNRENGLFKIFNEGAIQNQELADFTSGHDWMPNRFSDIRKHIGYTGKLYINYFANITLSLALPFFLESGIHHRISFYNTYLQVFS